MIISLITAVTIGAIAGYLGTLLITERMALVGGPLGHLALPGVALGILYGFDIFWGAVAAIVLGAAVIWLINLSSRLPLEAVTAVVFAGTVAVGFLLLPMDEAEEALIGDIADITLFDAVLAVLVSVVVFVLFRRLYNGIVLAGISEDIAVNRGVKVKLYRFLYLAAVALVVAMEVKLVGILLTAALMAIPAAAAKGMVKSLAGYRITGAFAGGISAAGGLALHWATALPAGPLIILSAAAIFFVTLVQGNFKP